MSVTDRAHLDDLALDELDAVVLRENPRLHHLLVFLDGEEPARALDLDRPRRRGWYDPVAFANRS